MPKLKLSEAELVGLRAAYEAWNPHDPASETAEQLAARFGISKQTMYNLRRKWIREDTRRRNEAVHAPVTDQAGDDVIRFLATELAAARQRIAELEAQIAQGPRA
jgi:transposase-like protein